MLGSSKACATFTLSLHPWHAKNGSVAPDTSTPPMKVMSRNRAAPAAPTLVRPNQQERAPEASPAPRKKKPPLAPKSTTPKKKPSGSSLRGAQDGGASGFEVGSEEWIEEQRRLTDMMSRKYSKPWDSPREPDEEDSEEEDLLAFYDHEAEEKALKERVAELKRVSSMPVRGVPSSSRRPEAYTVANQLATTARNEAAKAAAREAAYAGRSGSREATSAGASSSSAAAEPSPPASPKLDGGASSSSEAEPEPNLDVSDEPFASRAAEGASDAAGAGGVHAAAGRAVENIEPFSIGRKPAPSASWEDIEITLNPTPLKAPGSSGSSSATVSTPELSSEPPLTPRSLASSMAARRLAQQQMRTAARSAPTGA